jgi:photosystem II stability/assembly factor-like uncharacterized protein
MSFKMIRRVTRSFMYGIALLALSLAAWALSIPSNDWTIAGPFGGTARSIALDSQKPDVVLAGGMNALVFRSTDAGQNWAVLNFPKRRLSEVTSLLVDPADSNHYLAGMIAAEEGGLFESRDAGKTWNGVKGMNRFGVRALAGSASKPSEFVAGTMQGVWLSENSGETWKRISDAENLEMQGITAVAVDTKDPDIIYAGTTHLPWKTTDRGKNWVSIHSGMIDDSDVFSIYINPADPSSILASACSGIYSSDSRGDAWKKLMGIPNTSRRTHVIREDPTNADIIYAGTTMGLFKSINRGIAWRSLTQNQVNAIAFDPSHPGTIYMALEYEGLGKSDNGGETIRPLNQGFVDRAIASETRSGDKLFAAETQEGETSGIFASTDRGTTWARFQDVKGLAGVHLKAIAGLPSQSNVLLAASPHQLYKSIDGGNSWKPQPVRIVETIQPPPVKPRTATSRSSSRKSTPAGARARRLVRPIVKIHQVNPSDVSALYATRSGAQDLVFAATDLGLLKSTDAGERWTSASIPGSPAVSALYLPTISGAPMIARTAGGLYTSKDCGEHWESLPFPLSTSDVNEVTSSGDGSTLLAATRLGLYSSPDGGAKWYANLGGIPASTVNSVIFTNKDGVAYAVEYGRLFKTSNAGAAWTEIPTALPSVRIRRLWLPDPSSGRLYGITGELGILFRDEGQIR